MFRDSRHGGETMMFQNRQNGETVRLGNIGKFGTFAVTRGLRSALGCGKFGILSWLMMLVCGTSTLERSQTGRTWKIGVFDLVDIISVRVRGLARGG